MSSPEFSPQEAQALINHANTAPLQNMQHAAEASALINKFKAWYEHAIVAIESIDSKINDAVKKALADHENSHATDNEEAPRE